MVLEYQQLNRHSPRQQIREKIEISVHFQSTENIVDRFPMFCFRFYELQKIVIIFDVETVRRAACKSTQQK